MATVANALALALMRFGGGRGGGFLLTLFGLVVVGVLVWALTRPDEGHAARSETRTEGSSPAARAPE